MTKPVYSAAVFDVSSIEAAKAIILTPEGGSTDERWAKETPVVADLIGAQVELSPESWVLDYGCGIGRLSKELIARHGCSVIGVDISPYMRALAAVYVSSAKFSVCAPEMLPELVRHGVRFDLGIAVWVLQHCVVPQDDIGHIHGAVKPGGGLFLLNNIHRAVPSLGGIWHNDGLDIDALVQTAGFQPTSHARRLPEAVCPPGLAELTYWKSYRSAA